jgi:hypothetical protein
MQEVVGSIPSGSTTVSAAIEEDFRLAAAPQARACC